VREKKVIENPNFLKDLPTPAYNIQFDGFTSVLTAECPVIPNEVYHIKIAIADVADGILDSGVILEAGTFHSYGEKVVKIKNRFRSSMMSVRGVRKQKPLPENSKVMIRPESELSKEDSLLINRILNVEFEFDSYSFSEESKKIIKNVFSILEKNPDSFVEINGHTDNVGTDEYNLLLSERRARAVAVYLEELGVHRSRIKTTYFGEKLPIQSNSDETGRSRNRRVEFIVRISE
jgi:outer membrane protein OmpA-like peptidoglycan-associated protein